MAAPILIVPGLGGSGPDHWQSRWQARWPNASRVEQADWDRPDRAGWIARLDEAVASAEQLPILVAHSLSCALVACWAAERARPVHAALLVAPADVESDAHTPPEAHVFRPLPMKRLPFPAIVVASRDDPYVAFHRAVAMAKAWDAELVDIGEAGHINTSAGYGEWPEGERILARLPPEGHDRA
ncbi:RBBP9/YdeN family alpha/beta hydrolase [Dongia deserti]|uniref:RBBP9/YdeN family alpha/beta hydrolase n=1 Tax=Dongia deserti TaxID=2268030 RepID=UPI000E65E2C4|nr:alpha/beta hydrolase [Dongia deserti]